MTKNGPFAAHMGLPFGGSPRFPRAKRPSAAGIFAMQGEWRGAREPHEVLGLTRDASEDEIRRAYRRLALIWHPDRNRADQVDIAERQFAEIAAAYAWLRAQARQQPYASARAPRQKPARSAADWARAAARSEDLSAESFPGPKAESPRREPAAIDPLAVAALARDLSRADRRDTALELTLRVIGGGGLVLAPLGDLGLLHPPWLLLFEGHAGHLAWLLCSIFLLGMARVSVERRHERWRPHAEKVLQRARSGSSS